MEIIRYQTKGGRGVVVISFSIQEARNHLEKKGFVYTLRPFKRKRIGKDWYNMRRGGIKIKDVWIDYYGTIKKIGSDMQIYAKYSGFPSLEEWKRRAGSSKYLYKVTILKERGEAE